MPGPLGILAGGGDLPGQVAAAAAAAGRRVFLVGLAGHADAAVLAPWPHTVLRIGAAGAILAALHAQGCRDLVLIGRVRRPNLLALRPDAGGARILARLGRAAVAGDDGLLAAVIRVLGEEGFRVLGAQEVLTAALAPVGLLTTAAPDATARWPTSPAALLSRARWGRPMWVRGASCSRASCWRWRRSKAPMRCSPVPPALRAPVPAGCW